MRLEHARVLAATDEIEHARRATAVAERRRDESEFARKEAVNRRFDRQREQFLKKSIAAVTVLQEEFKAKLEEKDRLLQAKRQALQQKAAIFIQNELQRTILRFSSEATLTPPAKKKATERITAWVEQYLRSTDNQHLMK
jgi:hypothetical protein